MVQKNMDGLIRCVRVLENNEEIEISENMQGRIRGVYEKLLQSLKETRKSLDDMIKLQYEIEGEIEYLSSTKELSPPANFDYMFKYVSKGVIQ